MFGETVAHGCPFRRAWEDGCLQNDKVFQIGLRATGYAADDFNWGRDKGWTVVQAEECWGKSLVRLMEIVRGKIGENRWRLVMPYPRFESTLDVMELVPVP